MLHALAAPLLLASALQTYADMRPGVHEVRGAFMLTAPADSQPATVLVPLVLERPEQVPLAFELTVTPTSAVTGLVVRRDAGDNHVVEITLGPDMAGGEIAIAWSAAVLCAARDFSDLPKQAPIPKTWPEEARPWLAATRYAQADDPEIVRVAAEIAERSTDVLEIVDRTIRRIGTIYAQQEGRCRELGAVEALTAQGSCTSCANLVAALLRANKIPARIVSGYATWYGPHQTHYVVEAYVPGYGWYPVESTLKKVGWQPYSQIQVAVVPVEHEGASATPRSFAAGGVPYLSLNEFPGLPKGWTFRGTVTPDRNCDHVALCVQPITDPRRNWDDALTKGRTAWRAWLAESGKPDAKRTALATRAKPADVWKKCESLRDCARLFAR